MEIISGDIKPIIAKNFNGELARIFKPKEIIKKFLLEHPRKNICIENLCREIRKIELSNAVKLDLPRIEFLAKSYAKTFAKVALNYAEREKMTTLQKDIEQKMATEQAELDQFFKDNVKESTTTRTLEENDGQK